MGREMENSARFAAFQERAPNDVDGMLDPKM